MADRRVRDGNKRKLSGNQKCWTAYMEGEMKGRDRVLWIATCGKQMMEKGWGEVKILFTLNENSRFMNEENCNFSAESF